MMRHWPNLVAALAIAAGLLACASPPATGPSLSARATGLAETAVWLLTSTAAASITPITPTLPPTVTPTPVPSDTPVPMTATLVPTITPTPCAGDDADFVADVTIPDGTQIKAGTTFTKTWRVKNSGPCPWTTTYTLRNVSGELLGGETINLPNGVPPGAMVDLSVRFVAPAVPGKHISRWQLFNPESQAFGTKPFMQIMVP
jgi:hypothetical protein